MNSPSKLWLKLENLEIMNLKLWIEPFETVILDWWSDGLGHKCGLMDNFHKLACKTKFFYQNIGSFYSYVSKHRKSNL